MSRNDTTPVNSDAYQRRRRQVKGLMDEPIGEVPCSGEVRQYKAERGKRRDSWLSMPLSGKNLEKKID